MRKLRALALRLRGLFHWRRADDEFAAELESHVAQHTDDGIRSGLSPVEARRQALIRLGGAEQTHQAVRIRRTLPWLESLIQDTHYGLRTLRRSPGFTITAVLTLALGIGACTAIFSLVNAVLIRSLPYGDPSRLVYLYTPNPRYNLPAEMFGPAYGDFYDIKRESHSFQSVTAFDQSMFSLASQGSAERVSAALVDGDFFQTFQSSPELGRTITADDNRPGHERVAIISHALWQSMFGSATDILHRPLLLVARVTKSSASCRRNSNIHTRLICPMACRSTKQRRCGFRSRLRRLTWLKGTIQAALPWLALDPGSPSHRPRPS